MSKWIQLYVRHGDGPEQTKIMAGLAEPALMMFGAVPKRPYDEILLEEDGTVQIRAYNPASLPIIRNVLKDNGLKIIVVREVEN